jgi:hypothetical protein
MKAGTLIAAGLLMLALAIPAANASCWSWRPDLADQVRCEREKLEEAREKLEDARRAQQNLENVRERARFDIILGDNNPFVRTLREFEEERALQDLERALNR